MITRLIRICCLCCILVFFSGQNLLAGVVLDQKFGNDGRVAVELGVYGERANAVVVQPDGKIVVAGSASNASDNDFMVFRLLEDGSLDPDFNYDGTVTSAVGSGDDEALAVAMQDDGKIIAAGYSHNGTDRDFALVRYESDGSLDRNFGLEGMIVTPVGNENDEITGVALQEDGSIIVTGSASGTVGRVLVLARYLADGTLDTEFADGGFSFTGVGDDVQAESVTVLDDQRIVVSGSYFERDSIGMMVVGFTGNGELDESFGDGGIAVPSNGKIQSEGYGMIVLKDGNLLVAGSVGEDGNRDAALFQFSPAGKVVEEFDDDGVLITAVGQGDDVFYDVVETENGFAGSGFATKNDAKEFLLITYENSGDTGPRELVRKETKQQEDTPAWLRISQLLVQGSYSDQLGGGNNGGLQAEILTTAFSDQGDFATALAVREHFGIVAVGVLSSGDVTHAGISSYSYRINQAEAGKSDKPRSLDTGSNYIVTGEPYDVSRTTAVIPVTVYSDIGSVTERGIVFSTHPNPTLASVAASDTDNKKDNTDDNSGSVPKLSGLGPSGNQLNPVTLTVTTDVAATCKWSVTGGTAFDDMEGKFASTGRTRHTHTLERLKSGTYTYYVRCQDATGAANATDQEITFTVEDNILSGGVVLNSLNTIGGFFVSSAYAADDTSADTSGENDSSGSDDFFTAEKEYFLEKDVVKEGAGTGRFTVELNDLKPGTFFYARAYAIVEGKAYYGNNVGFRTSDSCFIATAAFGSVFHPCVQLLRDFRDNFMMSNYFGRFLIKQYYHFSPPVADVIAKGSLLRIFTRLLLLPMIGMSWLSLQLGSFMGLVVVLVGALSMWYLLNSRLRIGKI